MQHGSKSLASKRARALSAAIASGKSDKKELELLIRADNRREEVAAQLRRIGTVRHFYDKIQYISFRCDADYADILRKAASGTVRDSIFEKEFRSIVPMITGVELANTFTIPKTAQPAPKAAGTLWNLEAIGAYEAQRSGSGEGMKVAVIDSGVEYTHAQLSQRFGTEKGYDFIRNATEPMDENGHGTHVAGIIAADTYGVAPGARLYSLRILDGNGSGNEADAIAAIEWCIRKGIDVANMSFGGPVASRALEEVCQVAWQEGVLLVAAAGNDYYGPNYPAAFGQSVIAVAAVDKNNNHAPFSNIYETNDIAAPGVNILSTYLGGRYATLSGTSMASPHVAGGLALAKPIVAGEDLEELMKETADDYGSPEMFGAGLLRVDSMVKAVQGGRAQHEHQPLQLLLRHYNALEKAADNGFDSLSRKVRAEMKGWL